LGVINLAAHKTTKATWYFAFMQNFFRDYLKKEKRKHENVLTEKNFDNKLIERSATK